MDRGTPGGLGRGLKAGEFTIFAAGLDGVFGGKSQVDVLSKFYRGGGSGERGGVAFWETKRRASLGGEEWFQSHALRSSNLFISRLSSTSTTSEV